MAVPATTGQMRTRLEDMEIGDYIPCSYKGSGTDAGSLYALGDPNKVEIVDPAVNIDGMFYFIKVARGKLIADRCVRTAISWNNLNLSGWMDGAKVSNVARGKTVTASSTYSDSGGTASASALVNGSTTIGGYSGWWAPSNGDKNPWVKIDLEYTYNVNKFRVYFGAATDKVVVKVSTNNIDFIPVATILNSKAADTWEEVTIETPAPARYVMFDGATVDNSYGYNVMRLYEVEVMAADQFPESARVRLPTGGVGYMGEHNTVVAEDTTYLGYGAFPSNNEWDTLVVGFPPDKIQEGMTLDNVFDVSTFRTLTTDVLAKGITHPHVYRVTRGGTLNRPHWVAFIASGSRSSLTGVRPLIEYEE